MIYCVSFTLFFLFFGVVGQDPLHLLDLVGVSFLEDLLSTECNFLLEHLFVVDQDKLKPVALTVIVNIDSKILVNSVVLLLDEGHEVLCLVVELILLLEGLQELEDLGNDNHNYSDDNQVEQSKLDDQEEYVNKHNQEAVLYQKSWCEVPARDLALSRLEL